ncbi:MAG: M50 family metallopeptidase [Bacillota bacterium]
MRLGSIKEVNLAINPLFLLVCLIYLCTGFVEVLWVILALIVHEAGHVLMALICGLRLLRVELFPFGGQITTEEMVGDSPGREIAVAMAGPVFSLFSAGLTYIMEGNLRVAGFSFFMEFSLLLGLFNLLPALPLDGGRILKALCSTKVGLRRATLVGSWSGQILALVLLVAGLYMGYRDPRALNLLLVAGFMGYKAREEMQMLPYGFTRYLLRKRLMPGECGMATGMLIVAHHRVKVSRILYRNLPETIAVVLVIDTQGKVQGVLTERVLIEAMLTRGPMATLGELLPTGEGYDDQRS